MNDNSLSEKQRIEKAVGQQFLDLYNELFETNFVIVELSDRPDIICRDSQTERTLELEITLAEAIDRIEAEKQVSG
jgi:uncharacterized glyoxalase superfamily protein PhnB